MIRQIDRDSSPRSKKRMRTDISLQNDLTTSNVSLGRITKTRQIQSSGNGRRLHDYFIPQVVQVSDLGSSSETEDTDDELFTECDNTANLCCGEENIVRDSNAMTKHVQVEQSLDTPISDVVHKSLRSVDIDSSIPFCPLRTRPIFPARKNILSGFKVCSKKMSVKCFNHDFSKPNLNPSNRCNVLLWKPTLLHFKDYSIGLMTTKEVSDKVPKIIK
mmetsp:Transcript_22866/g.21987  ORF Transcript_22866/g.21987 Transcript_22866/m.21987 type:complete len:217 (-) Transcript_22866:27-677(-)